MLALLLLLSFLSLLLFQQERLFSFWSHPDKDFHFPRLGYPSPMIRLAVGLREEWSLAYRVRAGMVWFKALLALD